MPPLFCLACKSWIIEKLEHRNLSCWVLWFLKTHTVPCLQLCLLLDIKVFRRQTLLSKLLSCMAVLLLRGVRHSAYAICQSEGLSCGKTFLTECCSEARKVSPQKLHCWQSPQFKCIKRGERDQSVSFFKAHLKWYKEGDEAPWFFTKVIPHHCLFILSSFLRHMVFLQRLLV